VHLVGFILRIHHDARSFECQKNKLHLITIVHFLVLIGTYIRMINVRNLNRIKFYGSSDVASSLRVDSRMTTE